MEIASLIAHRPADPHRDLPDGLAFQPLAVDARGSDTVNVVQSAFELALIVPPCDRAIWRAMYSPSPSPAPARLGGAGQERIKEAWQCVWCNRNSLVGDRQGNHVGCAHCPDGNMGAGPTMVDRVLKQSYR